MAKIISFPTGKGEWILACPECDGIAWEILVDGPMDEKYLGIRCANEDCMFSMEFEPDHED